MTTEIIVGAFAILAIIAIDIAVFVVARKWLDSLTEIVILLRSMMDQLERITMIQNALHESFSKEFELIREPIVSLTGDTAKLRQQIKYYEREQRGNDVPKVDRRRVRTVEEDEAIG